MVLQSRMKRVAGENEIPSFVTFLGYFHRLLYSPLLLLESSIHQIVMSYVGSEPLSKGLLLQIHFTTYSQTKFRYHSALFLFHLPFLLVFSFKNLMQSNSKKFFSRNRFEDFTVKHSHRFPAFFFSLFHASHFHFSPFISKFPIF